MSAISEMRQSAQAMENAAEQFERQADLARKQSEVLTNSADELEQLESDSDAASNGSPIKAKRGPGRPKGSTAAKRGPGRPKGSTAAKRGPGRPKGTTSKRAKNKMPLRALVLEILKTNRSGLELKEVVSECRKAGYKSNTAGEFSQIVYQTLYKLMNDIDKVEKRKLVIKDAGSKKYMLKPKKAAA